MTIYEKLRVNLDINPAGAPASKALDKILKTLFTSDEAAVAVCLTFVPQSISAIAKKSGFQADRVEELCESMANKGIIYSRVKKGETGYSLLALIPGIFEFPFMAGGGTAMHEKLGLLWEEYHYENQGYEFGSSQTPLTRVMPVEESLNEKSEILPYEILSEMMKKNITFGLAECACRVAAGDKACDMPKDVCLIFDKMADFLIERKLAKKITFDQAMDVLKRSEESGLVHMTNNSQDKLNLVCNCCSCCCTLLTGMTKIKSPYPFAVGRWYAAVEKSLCIGCGICRDERCPVEAIQMEEEVAVITKETCIGCGLCTSECPENAIKMIQREEAVSPPATVAEMGAAVLMEKGRLEAFMELNNS